MCQIGNAVQSLVVKKSKPIVAYRGWCSFNPDDTSYPPRRTPGRYYSLYSYAEAPVWKPGKTVKASARPSEASDRGFWAFKTKEQAQAYMAGRFIDGPKVGPVKLWGDVVEHADGYRAEFAMMPGRPSPKPATSAAKKRVAPKKRTTRRKVGR